DQQAAERALRIRRRGEDQLSALESHDFGPVASADLQRSRLPELTDPHEDLGDRHRRQSPLNRHRRNLGPRPSEKAPFAVEKASNASGHRGGAVVSAGLSPRSIRSGSTIGSRPRNARYIAAGSRLPPRDKIMSRKRCPLARVRPPFSLNQ